jgi:hypothetical protein
MQVVDFERKGNVIRFYLGEKTEDWGWTNKDYKDRSGKTPDWLKPSDIYYGDDWNDRPYEHNAGEIYDEFIKGYYDLIVPFDYLVLEPCDDVLNSSFSKEDMRDRKVPCIIIVPKKEYEEEYDFSFNKYVGNVNVIKIYFGDSKELLIVKQNTIK